MKTARTQKIPLIIGGMIFIIGGIDALQNQDLLVGLPASLEESLSPMNRKQETLYVLFAYTKSH